VEIIETEISDVKIIKPDVFPDDRGFFLETFNNKKYSEADINTNFLQTNHSRSAKGVLRGLHYQLNFPQAKLLYVATGKIRDIAVDIRVGSPTFGKWVGVELSEENHYQLYVPEGFAHGFEVLSDTTDVIYMCSEIYHPEDYYGILWNDSDISVKWQTEAPILSARDRKNPTLNNQPEDLLPQYK
jgi:dTDP-4-dehydrorhamnose 3,5-epimerase